MGGVQPYSILTNQAIPTDQLDWSISDPTLMTYNPSNGEVLSTGQGKRGTSDLTVRWGDYADTAHFEFAYYYEIAPVYDNWIELPVGIETPQTPSVTDSGQVNCVVLQNYTHPVVAPEDVPDPLITDGITYYDTIEKVEWIVDDPSIVEAIPHISDSGEYCCTFKTLAPGRTFLTCKVTRTGGLIAHQYCDIEVYDENA